MKQKHFYSHIVEIKDIHIKLDKLDLSIEEREELLFILESSMHNAVIDVVLSHLDKQDKKLFLSYIAAGDHKSIWKLLKEKAENIENKISDVLEKLKLDFHKDIDNVKI